MLAARSIQVFRYLSGPGGALGLRSQTASFPAIEPAQRAVMVLLISALWLVASGHAILDDADPGFVGVNSSRRSSVEHGKHGPLDYTCSLDLAARRINRRLGNQPNSDGSFPSLANSPALPSGERPLTLLPASTAPLGLTECWQFDWRTALHPRAPSCIS